MLASLGWRGPWGTTYPVNLRIIMQKMTERDWVEHAGKLQARPPMPFWALNPVPRPPYVQFPVPPK